MALCRVNSAYKNVFIVFGIVCYVGTLWPTWEWHVDPELLLGSLPDAGDPPSFWLPTEEESEQLLWTERQSVWWDRCLKVNMQSISQVFRRPLMCDLLSNNDPAFRNPRIIMFPSDEKWGESGYGRQRERSQRSQREEAFCSSCSMNFWHCVLSRRTIHALKSWAAALNETPGEQYVHYTEPWMGNHFGSRAAAAFGNWMGGLESEELCFRLCVFI